MNVTVVWWEEAFSVCLDVNNKLIFLAILYFVYLIWSFHVKFSTRKTSKNFIDLDGLVSLLYMLSFKRSKGKLSSFLSL